MKPVARIHQRRTPIRRHYLKEWLEHRGLEPMDLVNTLNESESHPFLDKTQVYRWIRGVLPNAETQRRIEGVLDIDENGLLRHPDQDWLAKFFEGRTQEERDRIKQTLETAFPKKTGTDN